MNDDVEGCIEVNESYGATKRKIMTCVLVCGATGYYDVSTEDEVYSLFDLITKSQQFKNGTLSYCFPAKLSAIEPHRRPYDNCRTSREPRHLRWP